MKTTQSFIHHSVNYILSSFQKTKPADKQIYGPNARFGQTVVHQLNKRCTTFSMLSVEPQLKAYRDSYLGWPHTASDRRGCLVRLNCWFYTTAVTFHQCYWFIYNVVQLQIYLVAERWVHKHGMLVYTVNPEKSFALPSCIHHWANIRRT